MNILVLQPESEVRDRFITGENAARLEQLGEVRWNHTTSHLTKEQVLTLLPEADVVITGWGTPGVTGDMLTDNRRRLLAHMGGTVAPFTDAAAFLKGLSVTCANEIFARCVAEATVAYILAGMRRIPSWDRTMKDGGWRGSTFDNHTLLHKRIGLTGYGAITKYLLPMLAPFGVEILINSRHLSEQDCERLQVRKASLEEIFATCDVVSLHNGMNKATENMVGETLIGSMKQDALLVNTARGHLIDEAALAKALLTEQIYAVLDVYREEPLSADSDLRKTGRAILIPHMAGPTSDLYEVCGSEMIDEIARFGKGEPLKYGVRGDSLSHMTAKG